MSLKRCKWLLLWLGYILICMTIYFIKFGTGDRVGAVAVLIWAILCGFVLSGGSGKTTWNSFDVAHKDKYLQYLCIAIVVIANILCLILAVQPSFPYDEAYTVAMIRRNFGEIVDITSRDVHSPFYYIILKLFYHTFGMNNMISTRVFSWIFSVLTMVVGSRICYKFYGRKVECYWLVLMGFMPVMVIQSATARMYTYALFIITMAGYFAYSIYQKETWKNWVLFTLFSIMGVYVHTFCMITMVVIYGILLIALMNKKRYKAIVRTVVSGGATGLAFLPWFSVLIHQFMRWSGAESGWSNTLDEVTWKSIIIYLTEWFSSLERPQPLAIYFGIGLLLFSAWHVRKYIKEKKDYFPLVGVLVLAIVFGIAMLVSKLIVPCFMGRYVFPLFAGVWLFVAVGLAQLRKPEIGIVLMLTVVLCGVFAFREELKVKSDTGLEEYMEYMEENYEPGDIIMADTFHVMTLSIYIPDATYVMYGSAPECLPFPYKEVFTEWKQLDNQETVWYLRFKDFRVGSIEQYYTSEENLTFSNTYYDFVVEKMIRK